MIARRCQNQIPDEKNTEPTRDMTALPVLHRATTSVSTLDVIIRGNQPTYSDERVERSREDGRRGGDGGRGGGEETNSLGGFHNTNIRTKKHGPRSPHFVPFRKFAWPSGLNSQNGVRSVTTVNISAGGMSSAEGTRKAAYTWESAQGGQMGGWLGYCRYMASRGSKGE